MFHSASQVSGVQVALGYHRRPELTRASFTEEKGQRDARQMVERLYIDMVLNID